MPEAAQTGCLRGLGDTACSGRRSALLGLPEDLADLVDLGQQLVSRGHVGAALGSARPAAGQLGGLVEQRVELRVLLEVRRLEVVGPEYPQVVLDQLGALLLDDQGPRLERRVGAVVVLLEDRLDGLSFDPSLGWGVDPTGQVAVRVRADLGFEELCQQSHMSLSLISDLGLPVIDTTPQARERT